MRIRVSNLPGDASWKSEGPAFARTQGYGGGSLVVAPTAYTKTKAEAALDRTAALVNVDISDPEAAQRAKWRAWKQASRDRKAA